MTDEASDLVLPEITYPLVLDTVGKLIATGHTLTAYCNNPDCRHSAVVDLVKIARRYGVDFGINHGAMQSLLRCSACGGRGVKLTLHIPSLPPCR